MNRYNTSPISAPLSDVTRRPPVGRLVLRGFLLGLAASAFLILVGLGAALGIYAYYARELPMPDELYERTTAFKSSKVYDRHGRLLYEIIDPLGGRRTVATYEEIPTALIQATIATEDPTFFHNPGLDLRGILRALCVDLRQGEIVQGGSTITQQLVKKLFLTPERTWERKLKEAILTLEITRRYSKNEILEVYLNEVYLGNLAYGVGAAAEAYFGKHVSELTLSEAALLAGLIQLPPLYDPYLDPQAALDRRAIVLRLMHERGYITAQERDQALAQPLGVKARTGTMLAPHMVVHVRDELERRYGAEMLYKGGLRIYTTLDLDLQYLAEQIAREKIVALRQKGASNAALLALDPRSGDVLAMLGSVDFEDPRDGQFNVVTQGLRQPGSTIKPFTYLAALERGWTPATMLMDVGQEFPDGLNPPYRPHNYDGKEWGPISLRTALACSRNIPAVATLYQVGLPALLEVAQRLGIHSLKRPDYGLSLTLGGGEVSLWELTAAYGAFANGGRRVTPRTILRIEDDAGHIILAEETSPFPQVMDPRHAYLLTDILADPAARRRAFGANSPLDLVWSAAVKTGTTDDYRDSWAVGYTPDLVVGVWVGNNDNRPMDKLSGARGAGLIWHDFMERTLAARPPSVFARPDGLVEIAVCPISGGRHTDRCPPARKELFLAENTLVECALHKRLRVCHVTGKLATAYCPLESVEEKVYEDYGPTWDDWMRKQGMTPPPRESCDLHTGPTRIYLSLPPGPLAGVVEIRGATELPAFSHYVVEYGVGPDPLGWGRLTPEIRSPIYDGVLCRWDTRTLRNRTYTVRVVVYDRLGHSREARATVEVHNPS